MTVEPRKGGEMAISNAVKVGYISLGNDRFRDAIPRPEEKQAYVNKIARISVGETDPEAHVSQEDSSQRSSQTRSTER
jgi:hypothetical protein